MFSSITDQTFNELYYMGNTTSVIYETGIAYHWRAPGFMPFYNWARAAHHFSFLCAIFCFVFLSSVSLDCAFSIVPSGFSNVYL